jgi:hypothetical protein
MYYPYQYFSGANIRVYLGGESLIECAGISFNTSESNQPVYGYASHLYDMVLPGRRIIQGSFVVNFHLGDQQNSLLKELYGTDSFLDQPLFNIVIETTNNSGYEIDILNCFLTSRGQSIQVSENVLLEEYSFIARDIQGLNKE